ncbi:MAG: hypothetical protein K8W52_31205 [Deltaproteobacteria bacterium]|nr:hypothetical protein [Deltaproteobacteria bacterium]
MTAARSLFVCAPLAVVACAADAPACPASVQLHTWKPQHGLPSSIARQVLDSLDHDPSGPRPDWVLADPRSGVVVFLGSDAGAARAQKIAETFDVDRRGVRGAVGVGNPFGGPGPIDAGGPDPVIGGVDGGVISDPPVPPKDADDALRAAIDTGARQVDDSHWTVDRALLDQILANPMAIAKSARVIPAMKNGQPDGFKLYAIRPSSLFAHLGLQNGDTIHAINGFDLSSADKALEVYTKLRTATAFEVELTRRGRDLVQNYVIQ